MTRPVGDQSIHVRHSKASDERSLDALLTDAWGDFRRILRRDLSFLLSNANNATVVAVTDNTVVGTVMVAFGRSAMLHGLTVRRALRRRGIGTRLIKFILGEVRQKTETREIAALVERWDWRQRRRFKRLGFVTERDRKRAREQNLPRRYIIMVLADPVLNGAPHALAV